MAEYLEQIECSVKEDIPTADVRPERHGEWKINSDGYYPYCSKCGNEPQNRVMTDYCPNCGANYKEDDESDG